MQTITAEQATFTLHSVFLPLIQSELAATATLIGAIPADKGSYRPDEISKTAMELAWHLVATETRFTDAVLTGAFDLNPRPKPESINTPAELAAWYTENMGTRAKALSSLSGDQLAKVLDFRGMVQQPAVLFFNLMLLHSSHHRGQLSMYLRPMGAKVPSIYGESYDAAEARKAAAAR
jgi:uncharacterized damage-inducible protein DinB